MAWTKRKLIEQSFEELALASYVFDITDEELQSALNRLESLMATWLGMGLALPYMFSDDGNLDASSGLPLLANEAVYLTLAQRIAASKGKSCPPSLSAAARAAYGALLSWSARQAVREQQQPNGMPRGAGQKSWRSTQRPYFNQPDASPVQLADDGGLSFNPGS
jgi:hypothetical protein